MKDPEHEQMERLYRHRLAAWKTKRIDDLHARSDITDPAPRMTVAAWVGLAGLVVTGLTAALVIYLILK